LLDVRIPHCFGYRREVAADKSVFSAGFWSSVIEVHDLCDVQCLSGAEERYMIDRNDAQILATFELISIYKVNAHLEMSVFYYMNTNKEHNMLTNQSNSQADKATNTMLVLACLQMLQMYRTLVS